MELVELAQTRVTWRQAVLHVGHQRTVAQELMDA